MNIPQPNLQVPEALKNVGENLTNTVNSAKTGFNESISGFSQQAQSGTAASQQFITSNTIIAKFAFLILIIIVFLFALNLGIMLIGYFTSPSNNPYVVKGKINGNFSTVISTDPSKAQSVSINHSNNQSRGLEFTWSVWLFLNDVGTELNKHQHVFNKGDTVWNTNTGIASINNAPGVYFMPNTNGLRILMDTVSNSSGTSAVDVLNIPIRKWFNLVIRLENTTMDVYLNGIVTKRILLPYVPKQNYNDINICQNGGFSGSLSNLRYYNYALNAFEINTIVYSGPNTNSSSLDNNASGNYTYLANAWYSGNM
jgi:hypothetical protein